MKKQGVSDEELKNSSSEYISKVEAFEAFDSSVRMEEKP